MSGSPGGKGPIQDHGAVHKRRHRFFEIFVPPTPSSLFLLNKTRGREKIELPQPTGVSMADSANVARAKKSADDFFPQALVSGLFIYSSLLKSSFGKPPSP